MKRKRISLILFLILFLYSCSGAPVFENDELGNLIDAENGRLYLYCGSYLRAAEIYDGAYARYDDYEGKPKSTLHEIPGVDPAEWLSEDINKKGLPLLFRESGVAEPTLENFGTVKIHVRQPGASNFHIALIDDEEEVRSIVNAYLHGENINPPLEIETSLLFYFESPEYPGIYYVLSYYAAAGNGEDYLYDMWTKRCVLLP
jgi:hypothetical protein